MFSNNTTGKDIYTDKNQTEKRGVVLVTDTAEAVAMSEQQRQRDGGSAAMSENMPQMES